MNSLSPHVSMHAHHVGHAPKSPKEAFTASLGCTVAVNLQAAHEPERNLSFFSKYREFIRDRIIFLCICVFVYLCICVFVYMSMYMPWTNGFFY